MAHVCNIKYTPREHSLKTSLLPQYKICLNSYLGIIKTCFDFNSKLLHPGFKLFKMEAIYSPGTNKNKSC